MNNDNVLNEKFLSARLPDICAPRRALLNIFNQSASKRIIIVSAPAGFGKTVSTLLWLAASGRKSIWIGLDEYDNSPAIFYKLLCQGILSACTKNKAMAEILKSSSFSASPVEHTINLLSEFEPSTMSYALVFDDIHLITNDEIKKSLPYILRRLPMSFVTLILTRDKNVNYLEPYLSNDRATQITSEKLSFSEDEIQHYFKAYGRFITPEEAIAVKTVTGGWAIGVNVLVKSDQMEIGNKSGQTLHGYIREQIWDKWDVELREFMMRTSVVDEMTLELTNRLTGNENSKEILDKLCAANAFVSHLDDDTYRYHRIFLDFLRNLSDSTINTDEISLFRIAAEYYFETGNYFNAVRFAVKCEDYKTLASAMLELCEYSTSGSAVDTNISMIRLYLLTDDIPENVIDNAPYILISNTWYYYILGDAERFCAYIDSLYAKLPEIMNHHKPFFEHVLLLTATDFRRPITDISTFLSPEIIAEIAARNTKTTTLTENLPFVHRSSRDYSDFALDIDANMIAAESVFSVMLAEDYGFISNSLCAMLYYEKNMLKEAHTYASVAASVLTPSTVAELSFSVEITQATIIFATGNVKLAEEKLSIIEKNISQQNAGYLLPNFKAYETRLQLLDCNKKAAVSWLENYFVTHPERLELYKSYQHFTTARAYMVLGKSEEALRYILRLKKLGEDFLRPLDIAEASVLQAAIEWALGKRKEAQLTLEAALTATQDYGFVRIFSNEGAAVLPILRKIANKVDREDYSGVLRAQYIHDVTLAAYDESKRHKGITANINTKLVKLSKQQKSILVLLSQGLKYKEIVEETGLTIHTVKSHASAAYHKLNVNNSMDAILRARELGLIE